MKRKPTMPTEEIEEEDDYVNSAVCALNKSAVCAVDKTAATSDQKCRSFTRSFSPVAGCWVILIVIVALRIYFTSVISENNAMLTAGNQDLETQNQELTNFIHKLSSTVNNLTVRFDNLNKSYTALESNNTGVIAENQELKIQMKNLTEKMQDMESEWNKLSVSRAQWSIDQYCPINRNGTCNSCQAGWFHNESSCYTVHNARPSDQKTWDEAQADCKWRISELAVINNAEEKEFISNESWAQSGINGYWIGLRVVGGKWTWLDGSELTETSWIQSAVTGHCAISVQNQGLKSVSCSNKNAWICEKQALSLTPPS